MKAGELAVQRCWWDASAEERPPQDISQIVMGLRYVPSFIDRVTHDMLWSQIDSMPWMEMLISSK